MTTVTTLATRGVVAGQFYLCIQLGKRLLPSVLRSLEEELRAPQPFHRAPRARVACVRVLISVHFVLLQMSLGSHTWRRVGTWPQSTLRRAAHTLHDLQWHRSKIAFHSHWAFLPPQVSQTCTLQNDVGAKRSGRLLTRARKRLWLSVLGGTAAEPSSPRVSVTRWEKESSPVIHSRTALCNYYPAFVAVTTTSPM